MYLEGRQAAQGQNPQRNIHLGPLHPTTLWGKTQPAKACQDPPLLGWLSHRHHLVLIEALHGKPVQSLVSTVGMKGQMQPKGSIGTSTPTPPAWRSPASPRASPGPHISLTWLRCCCSACRQPLPPPAGHGSPAGTQQKRCHRGSGACEHQAQTSTEARTDPYKHTPTHRCPNPYKTHTNLHICADT